MAVSQLPTPEDALQNAWAAALLDPMIFLSRFVWTLDQQDTVQPVKHFPADRQYIREVVGLWLDNPLLVIAKSRQMRCTWLFCALYLWQAMRYKGQLIMLQSKREADAIGNETAGDGLMGRTKFILHHIPAWQVLCPKVRETAGMIEFPSRNSTIWAIPEGSDIIRQRTPSGILADEAAFQDDFSDSYVAAMACIKGAGRFTVLSTAHPGPFEALYCDTMGDEAA